MLLAGDDVVTAIWLGPRLDSPRIGAGGRLGESKGGELIPSGQGNEESLLLLLSSIAEDALLRQTIYPDYGSGNHGYAAELLDNQNVASISCPHASVEGGIGQTEVSHAAHLLSQLKGEFAFAIDLHSHRLYRSLGKIPGHTLDHFFLLVKSKIHFSRSRPL